MSGRLKRNAAPHTTQLTARTSAYHPSVTLFEAQDFDSGEPSSSGSSPRRSKRLKLETQPVALQPLLDIEDIVQDVPSPRKRASAAVLRSPTPRKQASNSPRKAKSIQQSLATPHAAPEKWRETYDTIKEMRSRIVAPVDTMGCDQAQYKEKDPKSQRFATLVSLMLSSQTKDEVTDAAVSNLRNAVGGSLTVRGIIDTDESIISEAIGKVGFWRRKTQYLKQTAQRLHDDFDSDVPKTVEELCSLPGVGPKMAFLTLQVAWNLNLGIGVDVHVHRITNRLGWHKPATKNPEATRLNLQSWLPIELHRDINHMLVGFGQTICLPVGPRCDICELSSSGLCPSAQKTVKTKNRKAVITSGPSEFSPKNEIAVDIKQEPSVDDVDPGEALKTSANKSFKLELE